MAVSLSMHFDVFLSVTGYDYFYIVENDSWVRPKVTSLRIGGCKGLSHGYGNPI